MSFSPEVHALSPKTPPPLPNPIAAVSSQSPALPLQDSPLIPPLVPLPEYDYIDTFQVKTRSCSRRNFCANMTRKLFTKEEMISCNVRGVKPNIHYATFVANKMLQLVACNTVYTGVNGACNMLHEIGNSSISCNMLQAPLTPV